MTNKNARIFVFPILNVRAFALLGAGAVLPAAGLIYPVPVLVSAFFIGLTVLVLVLSAVLEFGRIRRIAQSIRVEAEMPAWVESARPARVKLAFALGAEGEPVLARARLAAPPGTELLTDQKIIRLSTGARSDADFTFLPLQRGPLRFRQITMRIFLGGGLGAWQVSLELPESCSACVLPATRSHAAKLQAFMPLAAGEQIVSRGFNVAREFDSLRPYRPGDDVRNIDWKRSASGRGTFVKIYRPETHQRLTIAMDCSRRMGSLIGGRSQLDYAADAAASLFALAEKSDDELGLFAFDHRLITHMPPRRGPSQRKGLVHALTELRPGELEGDFELLSKWALSHLRRSLLVVITSASSPAALDSVARNLGPISRKHLVVLVAVADRDVESLMLQRCENVAQACMAAAAVDQYELIRNRLQVLREGGIRTLYCDASDLPVKLSGEYASLKRRGAL